MTQEELIKKISAEIAKLSDNASQTCEEYEGYRLACQDISDVLHEIAKEIQPSLPPNLNEELEKEIVHWFDKLDDRYCVCVEKYSTQDIKDTAHHFANWQKGQMMKEDKL